MDSRELSSSNEVSLYEQYKATLANFKLAIAELILALQAAKKLNMSMAPIVRSSAEYEAYLISFRNNKALVWESQLLIKDKFVAYKVAFDALLEYVPDWCSISIGGEEISRYHGGINIGQKSYTNKASFLQDLGEDYRVRKGTEE